jgi:hypothetical protein
VVNFYQTTWRYNPEDSHLPERKRPLGRNRHRWEDNIKTGLRETRWKGVDWIHLAQHKDWQWAFENMIMSLQVP